MDLVKVLNKYVNKQGLGSATVSNIINNILTVRLDKVIVDVNMSTSAIEVRHTFFNDRVMLPESHDKRLLLLELAEKLNLEYKEVLTPLQTYKLEDGVHYVYAVYIEGVLRYVGKGSGKRIEHCTSGTSSNYSLNKAHFEGKRMQVVKIAKNLSNIESLDLERELIKRYKVQLVNKR